MIAIAGERLEVPHAATAEYKIVPLALTDACRVLHDIAPEVRSQQAELICSHPCECRDSLGYCCYLWCPARETEGVMRRTCMWQADAQDVEDAARWTGGAPLLLRLVGGLLCCCHTAQATLHATASQAAGAQADRAADSAAGGRLRRLLREPATPERFACIGSH